MKRLALLLALALVLVLLRRREEYAETVLLAPDPYLAQLMGGTE